MDLLADRRTGYRHPWEASRALAAGRRAGPFRVEARDLGDLRPGLRLDSVAGLIEQVEGPSHR